MALAIRVLLRSHGADVAHGQADRRQHRGAHHLLGAVVLGIGVGVIHAHHTQEAVDDAAVAVHEVAVGVKREVAETAQAHALQLALGSDAAISLIVADDEETVAVNHDVQTLTGGVVVFGAHIEVDGTDRAAVSDLGGVLAAHGIGAVGAAADRGVQRLVEGIARRLVRESVDVGNIVADDVHRTHVRFQSGNSCIHCASHNKISFSFNFL